MGPIGFSKRRIKGNIGYFGLADWWLSAFTDEERRYISETFQPLGFSGDTLTAREISYTSQTSIAFLTNLAGWFLKANDRAIAYKILEKAKELARKEELTRENAEDRAMAYKRLEEAEELARKKNDPITAIEILGKTRDLANEVLGPHFMYNTQIELYYKDREKPGCLEKAIEGCLQQIELAPQAADAFKAAYKGSPLPWHRGYQQLAIILEKQANFREVIDLCARAQKEGWAGDWERRIERCRKKMAKG